MPIRFLALTTLLLTLASCAQTPVVQTPPLQAPSAQVPAQRSPMAASPSAALIGLPLATQTNTRLRQLSVSSGPVIGWGYDADGEIDVPAGLVNPVAVAAGGFHSLALQADGAVVAWGQGSRGQTTVPAGLSGVKAITPDLSSR